MKKKTLKIFTVLCVAMCLMLAFAAIVNAAEVVESGNCGTSVTYTIDDKGVLTISGKGATYSSTWNNGSPWKNNNNITTVIVENGVTEIGTALFLDCTSLINVTIPDSMTSIGDYAFSGCSSLENVYYEGELEDWLSIDFGSSVSNPVHYSGNLYINGELLTNAVIIPEGIASIKDYVFDGFRSLQSVTIPNSVTSIGQYAFRDCTSLTSVTIPDSVTSIGYAAFNGCSGLESVIIGNSVTSIGGSAFNGCSSIMSINIPDSVTSIGGSAFDGCNSLKVYITDLKAWCKIKFSGYEGNPLRWAEGLYLNNELVTNIIIPDGVMSIGDYVFYNCSSLESVTIPDSVTSIGHSAFLDCSSLESVTIPDSVTSIGDYAFCDCTSLTSVTIPDSVTSIGQYAFYGCNKLTSVVIGDSVTSIGQCAFYRCSSLESVMIPNSVISIGTSAFYECSGLANLVIGNGVTSTGNSTFAYCSSLTSVTIPDSITSIGYNAFSNCSSLESITIPDSLTSVSSGAFEKCYKLKEVNISDLAAWCAIDFADYSATPIYGNLYVNGEQLTELVIPEGIISIGDYTFYGCAGLKRVVIPDGVTNIGEGAFKWSGVTEVIISESVTNIGYGAFHGCIIKAAYYLGTEEEWAANVTVGDSNTYLLDNLAFEAASGECSEDVKWVLYTNGLMKITGTGDMADYASASAVPWADYRENITEVVIEDGVTSIGNYAFRNCTAMTSITMSKTVTSIGSYAFYYCSALESITLHEGIESMGNYAFYGCSALTEIEIPDGMTEISAAAFRNCSGLLKVTLPDTITSIGNYAFYGCSALENVYYGGFEDEWTSNVSIGTNNAPLTDATLNCSYVPEVSGECGSNLTWALAGNGTLTISGKGAMKGYTSVSDFPWYEYDAYIRKVVVEDGITNVANNAFRGYGKLKEVVLGDGVATIGVGAFRNCGKLATITMIDSVTSVGSYAFYGCDVLSEVIFYGEETSWSGISIATKNEKLAEATVTYAEKEEEEFAGAEAEGECGTNLKWKLTSDGTLTISGAGTMKGYASASVFPWYEYEENIRYVVVGDGVTTVSNNAFRAYEKLETVTIGKTVTTIGIGSFRNCIALTEVNLPKSIATINNYAFASSGNLATVNYEGTAERWESVSIGTGNSALINAEVNVDDTVFEGAEGTCGKNLTWTLTTDGVLTITGTGAMSGYASIGAFPWYEYSDYITSVVIGDGVTTIANNAFRGYINIVSVTMGSSVETIGVGSFRGNSALEEISMTNSMQTVSKYAFYGCTSFETINYAGTEDDWMGIDIGMYNDSFEMAEVIYAE